MNNVCPGEIFSHPTPMTMRNRKYEISEGRKVENGCNETVVIGSSQNRDVVYSISGFVVLHGD